MRWRPRNFAARRPARVWAEAQNNYGIMLAEGRGGLTANLVDAYAWLALAVENGANQASTGRDLVEQRLDANQLAVARERIPILRAEQAGTKNGRGGCG